MIGGMNEAWLAHDCVGFVCLMLSSYDFAAFFSVSIASKCYAVYAAVPCSVTSVRDLIIINLFAEKHK